MKFSFKTIKPTGKYKAFRKPHHIIKFKGVICGQIIFHPYKLRFQVIKKDINEDKNPNCMWKWITIKKEFSSLEDAKNFANENCDKIFEIFDIHIEEKKQ